jgi:hypothetical protein
MENEFEIQPCPECGHDSHFNGMCWECQECDHQWDCVDEEE